MMESILREPMELSEAELHEIAGGGGEFISVDDVDVKVTVNANNNNILNHNNIDVL
jgi:hypothetical protein